VIPEQRIRQRIAKEETAYCFHSSAAFASDGDERDAHFDAARDCIAVADAFRDVLKEYGATATQNHVPPLFQVTCNPTGEPIFKRAMASGTPGAAPTFDEASARTTGETPASVPLKSVSFQDVTIAIAHAFEINGVEMHPAVVRGIATSAAQMLGLPIADAKPKWDPSMGPPNPPKGAKPREVG
jgi:hypothetical protein